MEAEMKQAAVQEASELEEELARASERLAEAETEAMSQQLAYENRVEDLQKELMQLTRVKQEVESEYSTLKKTVQNKEQEEKKRQSMLEVKIKELEKENNHLKTASNSSLSSSQSGGTPSLSSVSPAAPPPPAPAPPPPPPPPLSSAAPPPPPGGISLPGTQTIKKTIKTTYRLPTLQLNVLKPNNVSGTFWYTTNDEKIINEIDFSAFEEAFKLNPVPMNNRKGGRDEQDQSSAHRVSTIKTPQLKSLMEHTRLKNVAIVKRRLPAMSLEEIIVAVNNLDNSALSMDAIELLQRTEPNTDEIKAYREYNLQKKDIMELTEEDRFMLKLSKVERLPAKLEIMSFMSTFYELLHAIRPRIDSICLASKSTRNAKKFKKVLEIILAFGNYMNSSKKGSAYGFRMSSLDNLSITKSSDKKTTIVHYIVDVVNAKYPDLKGFETELRYIDKAAQFSLENIVTDVAELSKGMNLTLKELAARQNTPGVKTQRTMALKDFCDNASSQLEKLKTDAENAKAAFIDCLENYGEDTKIVDTTNFFAVLVRFCASWKSAEAENIKRDKLKKAQELQKELENNNKNNAKENEKNAQNMKKNHASLINELKNKNNRKPMNHISPAEVEDGTLEQMIKDIQQAPYCPRRSVRRTTERLMSRNFDEDL